MPSWPEAEQLPGAMVNAFAYGSVALMERFVTGYEVAVPVIDDGAARAPCPPSGSAPTAGVYDYTARYTAGSTEFDVPARLSAELARSAPGSPSRPTRRWACATCPAPT